MVPAQALRLKGTFSRRAEEAPCFLTGLLHEGVSSQMRQECSSRLRERRQYRSFLGMEVFIFLGRHALQLAAGVKDEVPRLSPPTMMGRRRRVGFSKF